MKNVRGLATRGIAAFCAVLATTSCRAGEAFTLLLAQDPGVSVTKSTRGYVVESLVTVALFGLALWVVCKSSRRV